MKKTKILLSSILTIMLCVSLITGATFALFTSESRVNIAITSGKVQVEATIGGMIRGYYYNEGDLSKVADEKTGSNRVELNGTAASIESDGLKVVNFIPGYGFDFGITVTNHSTVAAKYSVEVASANTDTDSDALFKALDVKVATEAGEELSLKDSLSGNRYSDWTEIDPVSESELEAGKQIQNLKVTVEFPFGANDDELQESTCNLKFVVKAVQANAKINDSELSAGSIGIFSLQDLNELSLAVLDKANNGFEGKEVVLMRDIDFDNPTSTIAFTRLAGTTASSFTPIGTTAFPFKGTFNGNNCTIKNFSIEGENAALFGATDGATIKDLTIAGADVTANAENASAGLLVANATGTLTLSNITVEDCTVSKAEGITDATVGALVGNAQDTIVTVESVDVQLNENDSELGGDNLSADLVGSGNVEYTGKNELAFELSSGFVEKIVKSSEAEEESWYEVSSEAGLRYFADTVNGSERANYYSNYSGKTVKLMNDIDLGNRPWTPIGHNLTQGVDDYAFKGTFDGNEKTIFNLYIPVENQTISIGGGKTVAYVGLFGMIGYNSKVTKLTVENIKIEPRLTQTIYNRDPMNVLVGATHIGGVIGYAEEATEVSFVNVTGTIDIIGFEYVGGIIGNVNQYMPHSAGNTEIINNTIDAEGTVQATNRSLGGIVGWSQCADFKDNVVKNVTIKEDWYLVYDNTDYIDEYALQGRIGGITGIVQGNVEVSGNTVENVTIETKMLWQDMAGERNHIGAVVGAPGTTNTNQITIKNNTVTDVVVDSPCAVFFNNGIAGENRFESDSTTYISKVTFEDNTASIIWRGVGHKLEKNESDGYDSYWYIDGEEMLRAMAVMVNGSVGTVPTKMIKGEEVKVFPWAVSDNTVPAYDFNGQEVRLLTDIDLENKEWTPIGNEKAAFEGIFDGKKSEIENYTISNLTINAPEKSHLGLFGNVVGDNIGGRHGVIRNLDLDTVNITGKAYVGAVTGESSSGATFENCNVRNMTLNGTKYVAGISGHAVSALARNCSVDQFTITCSTILLESGKYDDGSKTGGIIGYDAYYGADACAVSNGTIRGYREIGGIAGYLNHAYCDGSTYATNCTVENVHIVVDRTHEDEYDGVKDYNANEIVGYHVPCNHENGDSKKQSQAGSVANDVTFEYIGCGLDPVDEDGLLYQINNTNDMTAFGAAIAKGAIFAGDTIELMDDITLTENWTPANNEKYRFKGTFDGNEHSIEGLKVNLSAENANKYGGLFSATENCTITDLTLVNPSVKNAYDDCRVGALIGRAFDNATIERVNIEGGEVYSPQTAAGFVAEAKNDDNSVGNVEVNITDCTNSAAIRAPKATGFVSQIQYSRVNLTNCTNKGPISMPNDGEVIKSNPDVVMGAFIGYCMAREHADKTTVDGGVLINCVNEKTGTIDATINAKVGKLNIGGLISSCHGGTFDLVDCINYGDITVTQNDTTTDRTAEIGGIVGSSGANMYHVEQWGDITVISSANTLEQFRVGGIVGDEDKRTFHMYGRSAYEALPMAEDGEERNHLECNIIVVSRAEGGKQPYVGIAIGSGNESNTFRECDFNVYVEVNGECCYNDEAKSSQAILYGMFGAISGKTTGVKVEGVATDVVLKIASEANGWDSNTYDVTIN